MRKQLIVNNFFYEISVFRSTVILKGVICTCTKYVYVKHMHKHGHIKRPK